MCTFTIKTFLTPHQETNWFKKFGWYGVAFFLFKGALWLLIPFIMYGVNSISLLLP